MGMLIFILGARAPALCSVRPSSSVERSSNVWMDRASECVCARRRRALASHYNVNICEGTSLHSSVLMTCDNHAKTAVKRKIRMKEEQNSIWRAEVVEQAAHCKSIVIRFVQSVCFDYGTTVIGHWECKIWNKMLLLCEKRKRRRTKTVRVWKRKSVFFFWFLSADSGSWSHTQTLITPALFISVKVMTGSRELELKLRLAAVL